MMFQPKSLFPTITTAAGMLSGGLVGAASGFVVAEEWIVVLVYMAGAIVGATLGAWLGLKHQPAQIQPKET